MEDGWKGRAIWPRTNITSLLGLYLLNLDGDTEDLEVMFNRSEQSRRVHGSGKCSALVKVLPNNWDIYISQVTWSTLESMLRMVKLYNLGYHTLPNNGRQIAATRSSFSSYPGKIQSGIFLTTFFHLKLTSTPTRGRLLYTLNWIGDIRDHNRERKQNPL